MNLSARRRLVAVGTALLVGAGVAGCAASPGSAAVVGSTSISESTILDQTQQVIGSVPTNQTADFQSSTISRALVQSAIRHQLVLAASAKTGIDVSDEQVNQVLAQSSPSALASQLGVPQSAVTSTVHDLLVLNALIAKLPPAGTPVTNVTVTIEGVPAASRADAVAKLARYLGNPSALNADIAAAGQQALVKQTFSMLDAPQLGAFGLFHAGVGDFVLLDVNGQFLVAKILSRSEQPAAITQSTFAAQQQQQGGALALATIMLAPYASAEGVQVNPRFGDWDPLSVQVVPPVGGW